MARQPFMSRLTESFAAFGLWNRQPVSPVREAGTSGTPISGGYILQRERNPQLAGRNRYETAQDILLNAAVVGAGMRFFINLVAKPKWTFEPAGGEKATDEAKEVAQFVADCTDMMTDAWARCVRRKATFRFYGFGIHEWTARVDEDARFPFVYESLEVRPWQTIERWDTDEKGKIHGVTQRPPLTGEELYIPRGKVVYLVDDAFSDSPEGIGLWRHLAEPFQRFKIYEKLEGMGFQRDLRGIPFAQAPYKALMQAQNQGQITEQQRLALLKPIEDFVRMVAKGEDTGLAVDSSPYVGENEVGETISGKSMFDMKLLTAAATGIADLGNSIDRVQYQMAMLCGTENMLVGGGSTGSRALSEDKSRNLFYNVDACNTDIVAAANKDFIPPLMILNNIPRNLWPKAKVESAAYLDALAKSQVMVNLANAGSPLAIADPAANQIRIEAGLSAVVEDLAYMDAAPDENLDEGAI